MYAKQTTDCHNPEYLVADSVIDGTDDEINAALAAENYVAVPGTVIHSAGFAKIKEMDLDGHWTEV